MKVIPLLQNEFEQEANTTRKFLKLIPDDQLEWRPHEKSMSLSALSIHLAEIPGWVAMMLGSSELDFQAGDFKPTKIEYAADLLPIFEKSFQKGKAALENAREEDLEDRWVMRSGDHIMLDLTKYEAIRHSLNQITHHRAQLGVYLRLLNIPIPGNYGPSADDMNF